MEFSSVHWHPTTIEKLGLLFCLFWPFVAISLMSQRGRSASPVAAALVPLAVSLGGVWLGLANVNRLMPLFGGKHATAAGIAEALAMFVIGGCFALVVIVFAAFRRHRPIVDRTTAALVAILIADAIAALLAATAITARVVPSAVLIAGAIASLLLAVAAVMWSFLTACGRVTSAALPYGVAVVAILWVAMGVTVWRVAHGYATVAMSG